MDAAPNTCQGVPEEWREGVARTERVEVAEGGTVALLGDGEAEAVEDWLREAARDLVPPPPPPIGEAVAAAEWVTAVSTSYTP